MPLPLSNQAAPSPPPLSIQQKKTKGQEKLLRKHRKLQTRQYIPCSTDGCTGVVNRDSKHCRKCRNKQQWSECLEELKEYKDINGHCNVPQNYEVNKDLANWVGRQRTEWRKFRDGKRAQITADRIALLDGLGFQWSPQEQKWSESLEGLKDYRDINGHCYVPSN